MYYENLSNLNIEERKLVSQA